MKNPIKRVAKSIANKSDREDARRHAIGWVSPNMQHLDLLPLTKDEIDEINQVWGKLGLKPYPLIYQMFKTIDNFNPLYLSDDLYYPVIIRALNPKQYNKAFAHKCHFPILFEGIKQPTLICLCNRGVCFSSELEVIDKKTAVELLQRQDSFIIKPATDSSCGKGVRLVKNEQHVDIKGMLEGYGDNWIAQEVLEQSEITARFNPSSLNTFRITTLFLNGKVTTQAIIFKTGTKGAVVDNMAQGGVFVGVSSDGELREFGYNNKYIRCEKTASEVELKGAKIKELPEMTEKMEYYHRRYFPSLGIVGWDVALDKNLEPVVIEANLVFPMILFTQLANSKPIFGDRTEEVIQFVLNKR